MPRDTTSNFVPVATAREGRRHRGSTALRRLMLTAAGSALVLGLAPKALAQVAVPPADHEAAQEVQEIVVTAQRRSENIQNVPVSVQALSAAQLEREGIKQTSDIARVTPNVTIAMPNGEGNQPAVTIRGIGLNDFNSNNAGPNAIYVDDVYISAPSAQTFGIFDINQIQVLKGPQGTLYGRNSSGGALVFTSRAPSQDFAADAHFDYGSYNTYQLQAGVSGPLSDQLGARLAFVVNHSDGFMHNTLTGSSASGTDNQAVRLQLLYRPSDKLKVLLSSAYGHVDSRIVQYRHLGAFVAGTQSSASPTLCSPAQVRAGGCVNVFGAGTPSGFYDGSSDRGERLRVENFLQQARADYEVGPVTLTSISAFTHSKKSGPDDADGTSDSLLHATYGVRSDTWTQEIRAAYSGQRLHWVAGAYYLDETLKQNQPLSIFYDGDRFGGLGMPARAGAFDGIAQKSISQNTQKTRSMAAFGQADYTLDQFTLTLGGRYTHERKTFDHFSATQVQAGGLGKYGPLGKIVSLSEAFKASDPTWRAALSYRPAERVMVYGSVATGFKGGAFNGGFLSSNANKALAAVKPVAPEKVTTYELGFKSSLFERRLVVNGAAFYNAYDNEQILANTAVVVDTVTGPVTVTTNVLTNARKAHSQGVELEVKAVPIPDLVLSLQPAWLRTRLDEAGFSGGTSLEGKQLANAPKFSLYAAADYTFHLADDDSVNVAFTSAYKSHQFFDSTNDPYTQQEGYWVHNASLTFQSRNHWDVGFNVRNLTGTKYYNYLFDEGATFGFINGVVAAPRTYSVQFNLHL